MKNYLIFGLLVSFLFSCKKEDIEETPNPNPTNVSVSGKAQKGPYKNGSEIILYELNSSLDQTGVSYSTTCNDDAGNFSFNAAISTTNVLVTATGFYYMEHYSLFSPYQLYLEAISDVQNGSTINVNLLTHLIKPRIEKLVDDGNTFTSARTQAQNELKTFLHVPPLDSTNFDKLDLINSNLLFATSLLFQRRTVKFSSSNNYTYWLSELMIRFRGDFRDNGQIDSQDIIDTLIFNANRIDLIDARRNLEAYMASLGLSTSLSGFEQYIFAFQKAYSTQVYVNTVFPDSAIWDIDVIAPHMKRNILYDTAAHFNVGGSINDQYLMTAIVPYDSSLVIKVTKFAPDSISSIIFNQYFQYGWSITSLSNGFSIEAQRKNYPNGLLVVFWGAGGVDSARVEYFMNNQPAPYFSKIIYW